MQIDLPTHIGAVVREVKSRDHEGKPARVVAASRAYDTDVDDLWDAITSAERIPRWFMPVSGDLRLGGRYQLEGNAGGTITACEPSRALALTWEFGGQTSWVNVVLTPQGAATRLDLEHISHVEGDFWDTYGPGAVGVGWELGLVGLDLYLRTGEPNRREEADAWSASDAGKAFMTASSKAWGEASIASGTGSEAARAAAARTTAFYTGAPPPGA